MLGETNKGTCFRERELWFNVEETGPCRLPLTDGKPCDDSTLSGPRCVYNKTNKLSVDTNGLMYITYPSCNKGA